MAVKTKKLLLFDIDGTLISVKRGASRGMLREVVAETLDIRLREDYAFQLGGKTDFQILGEIATEFGAPPALLAERREAILQALELRTARLATTEFVEALAGVSELVATLAARSDVALGLLTGNVKATAYLKLRPHKLDVFFPFGAFGCDHIERAKLPPIALGRANAAAGAPLFSASNTTIIGDTPNDVACARAHGIPVLAVASGAAPYERLAEERPDFLARDFSDTSAILDILTS